MVGWRIGIIKANTTMDDRDRQILQALATSFTASQGLMR